MNLPASRLDEAVTSTAPLWLLFYGCTWNLIHHYPSVIMEISGYLLGLLSRRTAVSTKDPEASEGSGKDFHINGEACRRIPTTSIVLNDQLNNVQHVWRNAAFIISLLRRERSLTDFSPQNVLKKQSLPALIGKNAIYSFFLDQVFILTAKPRGKNL